MMEHEEDPQRGKTDADLQAARVKFEVMITRNGDFMPFVDRYPDGAYSNNDTQSKWIGWCCAMLCGTRPLCRPWRWRFCGDFNEATADLGRCNYMKD